MSDGLDTGLSGSALKASVYVHVPFCVLKCAYCSFHSAPLSGAELPSHFARAVVESTAHWASRGLFDDVASVYIGGGTPTTLGDALIAIVDGLATAARLEPGAEVTVETNPDTTDPALVEQLVDRGVNRFSVGVQSFDDQVLRTLGRCHTASAAESAVSVLMSTGAEVAVDLMCGVPGQSLRSWEESVGRAIESGVGHVSVYPLSLEEGTPLAARVSSGSVESPDDDRAAEMMELAAERLDSAGLERYEVASYARPGLESIHNSGYWTGRPYLGIGPSAASMLPADAFGEAIGGEAWNGPGTSGVERTPPGVREDAARVRFVQAADTAAFVRDPLGPPAEVEYLTHGQAAAEDAMLGLRLARGISDDLAAAAGATGALQDLARCGLIEHVGGAWRVTPAGWLLGNEVFEAVWFAGTRRSLA